MILAVALFVTLVTAAPAIGTPDGLPNQGGMNSFLPFSSAATSQPFIDPSFIPFPSVQFSQPIVLTTGTFGNTVPQPFRTSLGSLQPSIGSPTSFLGSFTPAIGTRVTTLGSFQPSIGSPIRSLGSFAPSSGVPLVTLGSFQPGIGSPTTMLGSFQPSIGAPQPNIPVTVMPAGNLGILLVNRVFIPSTTTATNLTLTNGRLTVLDVAGSGSTNILNPEPSSLWLFGTALGGLAFFQWWSRRKRGMT